MKRNWPVGRQLTGGFGLNALSDDELYAIHLATLEVLEKRGVFVEDPEALDIFDGGGAVVDRRNRIAKIPPHVVEDAIHSAPSKIIAAGRRPENDVVLEDGRVNFSNFGEAVNVIDPYTGEVRPSTKKDLGASALLVDYLSDFDVYEHAVSATDVPQGALNIHDAEAVLTNTTKHVFLCAGSAREARKIIEIGALITGGRDKLAQRPIFTLNVAPVSPLKLVKELCEVTIEAARSGVQVGVISAGMGGASSPVTLAGTLVVQNAEILSGIVLSQLTRKGAPVLYGSSTTVMDLAHATWSIGSPELGMISAAGAQIARYYHLPSWAAGGWVDSKIVDGQAVFEHCQSALLAALAGANIIYGAGGIAMGMILSFGKLVMDNEFNRMIRHILRGIPVNDETLAVDVIHEVGVFEDFLSHDHTLKHMKTRSQPRLMDRRPLENWRESGGGMDIMQKADEEARRILENHKPEPLPAEILAGIRSIVEEAEEECHLSTGKSTATHR